MLPLVLRQLDGIKMTFIKDAIDAFDDNTSRIDSSLDPVSWNMNRGLLALAFAIRDIQSENKQGLDALKREVHQLLR